MTAADRQAKRQRFDAPLAELMAEAAALRDSAHGRLISYSRKVFIPLTKLCRDVCHYCTFAKAPRHLRSPYMSLEEAVEVAARGGRSHLHASARVSRVTAIECVSTRGSQHQRRNDVHRRKAVTTPQHDFFRGIVADFPIVTVHAVSGGAVSIEVVIESIRPG